MPVFASFVSALAIVLTYFASALATVLTSVASDCDHLVHGGIPVSLAEHAFLHRCTRNARTHLVVGDLCIWQHWRTPAIALCYLSHIRQRRRALSCSGWRKLRPLPILKAQPIMKTNLLALSLALCMASVSGVASAGCLKGALVGGVAGHVAGKHGLAGAAAGCAVGHHLSKKKQREQAAAQAQANAQAQAAAAKKK
jgi:hypothetical protein